MQFKGNEIALPKGMSEDQYAEILAQCEGSLKNHCQLFHGSDPSDLKRKRFSTPFSKRHDEFFEVWDDPKVKKILITAHRGWGKTSIFGFGAPSQSIVFQKYPFIVYVGATLEGGALLQTENLKKELVSNPMISATVGKIRTGDTAFSKMLWETANGSLILPRGRGQQVRGVLHGDERVNLIIVDDLEDKDSVGSRQAVDETERYFRADLENTVDLYSDNWRIVVIGTILSHDTLLNRLRDDPSFVCMDFPICDEKTMVTFWPERISNEAIAEKHLELKTAHRLDIWAREFLNKPAVKEDAVFRQEYFRYFSEIEGMQDKNGNESFHINFREEFELDTFVLVDPAKSATQQSCLTAIVGITVGFGKSGNRIFIRDVINERLYPDEIVNASFDMADRIGASIVGYEVTGLNEFIRQPFNDIMFKRGKVYQLVELKARKGEGEYSAKNRGKEGRIAGLAPYYRMGCVYHNVTGVCDELEGQLMDFPLAKDWDIMDATAYIVQMLEFGGRVMEEVHSATEEDMYQKLEREDAELERQYNKLELNDEPFWGEVSYVNGPS